ncbi:PREDICTED: uncharacterized protein LOC106125655 [Papilio xuthus]|uniref:Uncharacterized protein LOC106125655 n=1 Tax=Papilio xuthus TaxID=66420 RepID=A0AAJ7EI98_PAPXU|nr:PREDICTED: uncharacterized protein LOC106125655 [Papilio xuthus]
MLAKELFMTLITFIVFCHGTLDKNVNSRIKRLHEDLSKSEENVQITKNDEPTSRNDDLINLHIDDVTRLSQNIPKLSNIKNIITNSIPIPGQFLGDNNENQQTELNKKPNDSQGIESIKNNIDSTIVPTKRRPTKKKVAKNNKINDITRSDQNKLHNKPHNLTENLVRRLYIESNGNWEMMTFM